LLLLGRQEGHPACKKTEWWGAGVIVCLDWLVGVEFNAPLDTIEVISEAVFTANHLTDTDKQNSAGKYR